MRYLQIQKNILLLLFIFLIPFKVLGFSEKDKLQKIEKFVDVRCNMIGDSKCIGRILAISACSWVIRVNNGEPPDKALFFSDKVLLSLLKGNKKNIEEIFDNVGSVKKNIKYKSISSLKLCREDIKKALPNIITYPNYKFLTDEDIEDLVNYFPIQYLNMLERVHRKM
tara:strand:- start:557 stop:1060 length:504 start_codon:yes stop_codon:yes gene_type:complete